MRDYRRLSGSRGYAEGNPLPIPFEAVDRYCRRFGPHSTDAFERFLTLIEVMDAVVLERARER